MEIIKKDIYIIKNKLNNKIYVGQATNSVIRFAQHCKPCNIDNSIIGKAIKKYGKENFELQVLERQVANYNEREKYWIKHLNSLVPYGYNVLKGGDEPPRRYGDDSPNCKLSDAQLDKLRFDLIHTNTSYGDLAIKYQISKRQVLRINNGTSRVSPDIEYPLRKEPNKNGKLSEEDIILIIDMLKHTYLLNGEIAKRFNVECHTISKINSGEIHRIKKEEYPIREWKSCGVVLFTYEQVTEIINLLLNTNLSLNKIAKKYNVNVQPIQEINNGSSKKYRRKEIIYPIRNY